MQIDPIKYQEYASKIAALGANPYAAVGQNVNRVDQSKQGIPFGQLTAGRGEQVAPVGAKQNYENGLAPLSQLQNVYAGEYKGKENILNQIGIA